jgi:PiT family inorganic phosphate transporter
MTILLSTAILGLLAYANGANDNFKGVATLYGSGTTDYKKSLYWATFTTFLGSITTLVLAQGLLDAFSGNGLVPSSVVSLPDFSLSISLAAALTILLATKLGLPVSTTHALTGAMLGAGWLASDSGINTDKLGSVFFLPLAISPVVAAIATTIVYPIFRWSRNRLEVTKETCVCIGTKTIARSGSDEKGTALILQGQSIPTIGIGEDAVCREKYFGAVFGIDAQTILDYLHFLSAGIVSFARGLNDTPKIAALLLAGSVLPPNMAILGVALAMAVGGLTNSRAVAETMSHRVTAMNSGQGFTANLITGIIVIFASKFNLPVSTTHVSCGALFGIGAITRQTHWRTIADILLAWVTTLPLAALLGAICFIISQHLLR